MQLQESSHVNEEGSTADSSTIPISSALLNRRMTAPAHLINLATGTPPSRTESYESLYSNISSHSTSSSGSAGYAHSATDLPLYPITAPHLYNTNGGDVSPRTELHGNPFDNPGTFNPDTSAGESPVDIVTAPASIGHSQDQGLAQAFYDPFQAVVKHRRRTTAPQLKILESHFEVSTKPDVPMRKMLAERLGMTPREVQVWFQNRRAKVKRIEKRVVSPLDDPDNSGPNDNDPNSEDDRIDRSREVSGSSINSIGSERMPANPHWGGQALHQTSTSALPQGYSMVPFSSPTQSPTHPPRIQQSQPNAIPILLNRPQIDRRMSLPVTQTGMHPTYSMSQPQHPTQQRFARPWPQNYTPTGANVYMQQQHPQHHLQYSQLSGGQQHQLQQGQMSGLPSTSTEAIRMSIPFGQQTHQQRRSPTVATPEGMYATSPQGLISPYSQSIPVSPNQQPSPYRMQQQETLSGTTPHAADFASYVAMTHQRPQNIPTPLSSSASYTSFNFEDTSGMHSQGSSTPTSAISGFSYATSVASESPSIKYPPGFDADARRASCPADFIQSFDNLGMPAAPLQATDMGWSGQAGSANYAMTPQGSTSQTSQAYAFEPIPAGLGGPRRHSVAAGACQYPSRDPGAQPFPSDWVTTASNTSTLAAPFPNPYSHRSYGPNASGLLVQHHHDNSSRRPSSAMLDTIAEQPYIHQPQPTPGNEPSLAYSLVSGEEAAAYYEDDHNVQRSPSSGRLTAVSLARKARSHSNISHIYKSAAQVRQLSSPHRAFEDLA